MKRSRNIGTSLAAWIVSLASLSMVSEPAKAGEFIRGDVDANGVVEFADALYTLQVGISGSREFNCADAADVNDDGSVDFSDALLAARYVIHREGEIAEPSHSCGEDPTPDTLTCSRSTCQVAAEVVPTAEQSANVVQWHIEGANAPIEILYSVVDGLAIAEGDMILGREEDFSQPCNDCLVVRTGHQSRWPDGVIPFEIDEEADGHSWPDPGVMRARILDEAIPEIHRRTGLRLVDRTNEDDFVVFTADDAGCSAHVGRQSGAQRIRLATGCGTGSVIHEILHAAGAHHEQNRCDRDSWIRILDNNIQDGREHNFGCDGAGCCNEYEDLGSYDFASIMHYPWWAFGRTDPTTGQRLRTIEPIQAPDSDCNGDGQIDLADADCLMGQRATLSHRDVEAINSLYGPPAPSSASLIPALYLVLLTP